MQLDPADIRDTVLRSEPGALAEQQQSRLDSLTRTDSAGRARLSFYDRALPPETKAAHFAKLFEKLRLTAVHGPFLLLEMGWIPDRDLSPFDIFAWLARRLRASRLRRAFDEVAWFAERREGLAGAWGHFADKLLWAERGKAAAEAREMGRARAARAAEREGLARAAERPGRRALAFLCSVLGTGVRRALRAAFAQVRGAGRGAPPEKGGAQGLDIEGFEDFLVQKAERDAPRQVQIVERPVEVEVQVPVEVPLRVDSGALGVQATGALFHREPGRRAAREEAEAEAREDERRARQAQARRQRAAEATERRKGLRRQRELLAEVNQRILAVKAHRERRAEGAAAREALLGELKALVDALDQFEAEASRGVGMSSGVRGNLEQIMDLAMQMSMRLEERLAKEGEAGGGPEAEEDARRDLEALGSLRLFEEGLGEEELGREAVGGVLQAVLDKLGREKGAETEEPPAEKREGGKEAGEGEVGAEVWEAASPPPPLPRAPVSLPSKQEQVFDFLGLLSFKLKKQNRLAAAEAFGLIWAESRAGSVRRRLRRMGHSLRKASLVELLAKLGVEVNRRNNVRNQTLFKLSRLLDARLRRVLRALGALARRRRPRALGRRQDYHSGGLTRAEGVSAEGAGELRVDSDAAALSAGAPVAAGRARLALLQRNRARGHRRLLPRAALG